MIIVFTYHARTRFRRRKVESVWVEETIKFPDITEKKGHKFHAIKKLNGKTLKVIYVRDNYIKVLTLYYIRK